MMRSHYLENKLQGLSLAQIIGETKESNAKAQVTAQAIFKEYHRQYDSEIKYTLNQYFYKLLQSFQSRGKKIIVET